MRLNMLENMQKAMQKTAVIGGILLSSLLTRATWAHESVVGHHHASLHVNEALIAGFQHTLSGADHVILALGLGVLLCLLKAWLKPFTAAVALLALVFGFVLGSLNVFNSQIAEMGIGVSFVLMLVAFWTRQSAWLMLLMIGVACHGMAHGLVVNGLAISSQTGFLLGMLVSFGVVILLAFVCAQYLLMTHRKNAQYEPE